MEVLRTGQTYKLLPYDQLPDITHKDWESNPRNKPLTIERKGPNGKHLTIIGVDHRTDPGNEHYQAVLDAFYRWEETTRGQSRIVLVEGSLREPRETLDDSYRRGSEGTMLAFLARKFDIDQGCLEPPKDGIDDLLNKPFTYTEQERLVESTFTIEDHLAWMIAAWAPVWLRRMEALPDSERVSFEDYTAPIFKKKQEELELLDKDFSYDGLVENYKSVCGHDFDPTDTHFLLRQSVGWMLPIEDRIQAFAKAKNFNRDNLTALGHDALWDADISAFEARGLLHVLTLQEFFEDLGSPLEINIS